jgi:hypothetical protein
MNEFRLAFSLSLLVVLSSAGVGVESYAERSELSGQQQPRTGRSYESGDPMRKPPTSAPQFPSPVTFTDMTAQCGISFKHAASATSQKYLLETMGAGVAMIDYDSDGRLDLYFTNGARLEDPMPKGALPDNRDPRYWNRLYRQRPDGRFEDTTERAGVKGEGYCMGAAVADYNNDGRADIFVTGYGANILYENNGDGTFRDVTRKAGLTGGGWSTSAGWIDYNNDGLLDLFVVRYVEWDFERGGLYCGDTRPGFRAYCHPDNFKGATNLLYRQRADRTFEDVSRQAKIADPDGKGLGVAFADFDNDGWLDIAVANDSVRQSLYRNKGDSTFEDIALPAGMAYNDNGKTFAGMGIDAADFNHDGYADIFITALSNETYPLFQSNGDDTFNYVTNTLGVAQITLPYSGWGTRFIDADNDGLRDIFVAQGHVLDTIEKTSVYLKYRQMPLLMRNTGKDFVNVSASAGPPFNIPISARGAAFGDMDNDGDIDIVLGVIDGPPLFLRNNGTRNHWIGLEIAATKSNRNGIGARITVTVASGRKRIYEVTNAGSYISSSDPRVIVGLGAATAIENVEVRWPDRQAQTISNPAIDRYHKITLR